LAKLTCEDWRLNELNQLIYLDEDVDSHLELSTTLPSVTIQYNWIGKSYSQDLEQVVSLLVGLSKQAERESGNGVVAPRAKEGNEECLSILSLP